MDQPLANIRKTTKGKELLDQLENAPGTDYLIIVTDKECTANTDYVGGTIVINPYFIATIFTTEGYSYASRTRVLAHELGHLTGTKDDGPNNMNNVNTWENPIMEPLEGYRRTKYEKVIPNRCGCSAE